MSPKCDNTGITADVGLSNHCQPDVDPPPIPKSYRFIQLSNPEAICYKIGEKSPNSFQTEGCYFLKMSRF